jgi:general secretion pathway protein N
MKTWHVATFGLLAYAVAIVAGAPVTLVDAGLERLSQGRLRVIGAQGRLWSGSGQIELRDASGRAGMVKDLSWSMRPLSLLRGQLACDIEFDHSGKPVPVVISPSRVELASASINLPAAAIGLGVPKLLPLGLTGDLSVQVTGLSIGREDVRGKATLQWQHAGSVFTSISPLGDYELELEAKGKAAQLLLRTLRGVLQLDGKGSWQAGERPDFVASAQVAPQHRQQLDPLLRLIAIERGAGRFELRLN